LPQPTTASFRRVSGRKRDNDRKDSVEFRDPSQRHAEMTALDVFFEKKVGTSYYGLQIINLKIQKKGKSLNRLFGF
jgi:hypothetical protein